MPSEPFLIVAIASFVVGFLLGRSTASGSGFRREPMRIQMLGTVPEDVEMRVRLLIDRGHKIEALKELRQATGLGLKQAKDIVDSMASGNSLLEISSQGTSSTNVKYQVPVGYGADAMDEVKKLLRNGKKIEAIKLYRQVSGLGLKEAKDEIDRMTR